MLEGIQNALLVLCERRNEMKRSGRVLAVLCVALFVLSAGQALAMTFVTLGTGGVGGTWYPLGGVMAEVLSNSGIGVKATSRATGASQENCRLLASERVQVGMSMGVTLYQAYTGTGFFEKDGKLPLATLMNMYPAPHHLVTVKGTGIEKFDDIRGKKVVFGAPGSGDEMLSTMILQAAGMDPEKDVKKELLTMSESTMALKDGNIDAVFWNFPTPGAAYLETAASRETKLIAIPEDVVKKVTEQNPFLFAYTIKAGTYDKQDQDVLTVADGNYLVVNSKMEEKLGYDLVKTILDNKDAFLKVTKQAEHFIPTEASQGIIPFAKGAVKYFAEQGITVK